MSDPNDKTRIIRRSGSGTPPPSYPPLPPINPEGEDTVYRGAAPPPGHDEATRIIRPGDARPPSGATPQADPQTVLVRRPSSSKSSPPSAEPQNPGDAANPVVGWLVVVEGPGRGHSLILGYGQNSIGRESGNRVVLGFGDPQISRQKHAILTYDPRGRKFYLQHGESTNLTYLDDSPVLAPVALSGGELIRIGDHTILKFVPLCGDEFDWND